MEKNLLIRGLEQYDMDTFRAAYALVRSYRKERPYPVEGERKALPYEVDIGNPLYRHAVVYETSAQLVVRFLKTKDKKP